MRILMLILLLLLVGCENSKQIEIKEDEKNEVVNENEVYTDDNPIELGLYLYDNSYANKEVIRDSYYTNFISGTDLGSFEVFYSKNGVSGTNFKDTWYKYYDNYENIDQYKIGFNIKFILDDTTNFNKTFLEPDIYYFGDYFYIYFYDDIHQVDGTYYSHLEEMNSDTLITSVKLYATDGIERVENIILTVFTYDDENDFDQNGDYRGNSRYTIRIKKNNSWNLAIIF